MEDIIILIWYIALMTFLTMVGFRALMSVDFSKIFKNPSTWQIRFMTLTISISIAYLVTKAFIEFIQLIFNLT